jgi:hypothetical protein
MKQFYYYNDIPYILHRKIPMHNFIKDNKVHVEFVKGWRDYLGCDHVIKDATHFLFVEIIHEIDFEEITSIPQK